MKGTIDVEDENNNNFGPRSSEQKIETLYFIADDLNSMGTTLEKLLQFDQRAGAWFIGNQFDFILATISENVATSNVIVPLTTAQDMPLAIVCRV